MNWETAFYFGLTALAYSFARASGRRDAVSLWCLLALSCVLWNLFFVADKIAWFVALDVAATVGVALAVWRNETPWKQGLLAAYGAQLFLHALYWLPVLAWSREAIAWHNYTQAMNLLYVIQLLSVSWPGFAPSGGARVIGWMPTPTWLLGQDGEYTERGRVYARASTQRPVRGLPDSGPRHRAG